MLQLLGLNPGPLAYKSSTLPIKLKHKPTIAKACRNAIYMECKCLTGWASTRPEQLNNELILPIKLDLLFSFYVIVFNFPG